MFIRKGRELYGSWFERLKIGNHILHISCFKDKLIAENFDIWDVEEVYLCRGRKMRQLDITSKQKDQLKEFLLRKWENE